jgi:hypothetical protein
MPTLYIRGESGATLDATRRALASINAVGGTLKLASLAPEELSWKVKSSALTATDTIIPDTGQAVSLYLDEDRLFRGHVVGTEITGYGVTVRVAGPWWWLTRQEATSEQLDEEGTGAERPVLEFSSQGWDESIADLIDLAETGYGLPVTLGTIPTFHDLPFVRYKLTSLADVLTNLAQWCGDAVLWWDHSAESGDCQAAAASTITLAAGASAVDDHYNGLEIEIRDGANAGETRTITDYDGTTKVATVSSAWTTTPTAGDGYTIETKAALNGTRRGSATSTTYTLGTDAVVEPLSFRPRIELQVSRVELPYLDRDGTTEAIQYQEQASGTLGTAQRLIVPISGFELSDFLPPDPDSDSTHDFTTTTNDLKTALEASWPGYTDFEATYSEGGSGWVFGVADVDAGTKTVSDVGGLGTKTGGTWTQATKDSSRRWIVFETDPPQWAIDEYELEKWSPSHVYFVDGNSGTSTPTGPGSSTTGLARRQGLVKMFGPMWYWLSASKTTPTTIGAFEYIWAVREILDGEFSLWTIPLANIPGSGPLVKGGVGNYTFWAPPTGLAAAMLAASNWVPWEGRIVRQLESIPVESPWSRKYNLGGSLTSAASAGALPKGYEIDLDAQLVTVSLGPPDRLDYPTLVNRTERSGAENVVEL